VPTAPSSCVVLVPSGAVLDRGFEAALTALNRRGYPVRRVRQAKTPPGFRDKMAADALAAGFAELLWLDPAVVFDPADVEKLRGLGLPVACGVYPWPGRRGLVCEFPAGTTSVRFGRAGGPVPVLSCGLGFALVRREVFDTIAKRGQPGTPAAYFAAPEKNDAVTARVAEDVAFCSRARAAGFEVVADTSIRLWHVGPTRLGWEDAGGDRPRHDEYTLHLRAAAAKEPGAGKTDDSDPADPHPKPYRTPLRTPATPLPDGFPRIGLYVVTYPANAASLAPMLESIHASDWGAEPVVVTQPEEWPKSRESGSRNYKRTLEAAAADGCDFALLLEDDVRVSRHIKHNLSTLPLVARDQCDYLGLYIPDLIADPWERREDHLGYRLARPRYAGPNALWARGRVWGAQGLLLSRRLVLAALARWDRLAEGQDTRVMSVCAEFGLPLWYTSPCLVEHAPLSSAFGTPTAHAPDFDPDFRLEVGAGFQPPEEVPGWLTLSEAGLLWRSAAGRDVLELGTRCGRSTVCLGQSANRVVAVDVADQSEAAEWARRFGVADRVEFIRGDAGAVCRGLTGKFGLAFIDTLHDAASVERDIAGVLPLLAPGGLLAFHDYPDPGWPDVRRVVDEHARRLGWKRVAQADFLGLFRT
jgi:hypothetical protein